MDSGRQAARRFLTTRMALAFGFGVLLTLLVLSGLNAVSAISQLQSSNENILQEFLARQTRLDELRSAIYLSGTYVRDYLLEPEPGKAEQSRMALAEALRQIQSMAPRLESASSISGQEMYDDLRREMQEYWRTLDPVLTWDARERHKEGYRFLHDEVLPRRSSTLSIADTIASVNQQQLVERDHRLFEMFSGLRNKLLIALAAMFLCGLALAFATAFHILRLEGQTIAHLQEVTNARQELRSLSARLVETQENERKNISRELHDAVGQSMSAVQFELHDLGVALAPYPEPLRTRVDRIRELVESSVAMVRNMALLLAALHVGRPRAGRGARMAGQPDLAVHRRAHRDRGRRPAGGTSRGAQYLYFSHRAGSLEQRMPPRPRQFGGHRAAPEGRASVGIDSRRWTRLPHSAPHRPGAGGNAGAGGGTGRHSDGHFAAGQRDHHRGLAAPAAIRGLPGGGWIGVGR